MSNFRHVLLGLFFVGLVTLEIGHGLWRIATLQEAAREKALDVVRSEHADLARALAAQIEAEREHAVHLARTPVVRELLDAKGPGDAALPRAREVLLPYLASFRTIDCISVLDGAGRERLRCQRIGQGVGSLPPELLATAADTDVVAKAGRAPAGEAVLLGLQDDPSRVEVPAADRRVVRYAAPVPGAAGPAGFLVVAMSVAPFLRAMRAFAPIPGVEAWLVGGQGELLVRPGAGAGPEAEQEGAGGTGARLLSQRVLEEPEWRVVARVPAASLGAAADSLESEYARIVILTVAVTAGLIGAAAYLVRLSVREVRLREVQRFQEQRAVIEEQLRISDRLSSLGLLTAGVAHEINNPLEGIGNYLALLERDGVAPERRRHYLGLVRHGFDRIRDIVRDLSALARPSVQQGRADLQAVVERAVRLAGYGSDAGAVEVRVEAPGAPIVVPGDAGRLEQVFLNLILNAGRAMGGRGTVSVAIRDAAREPAGSCVEVVVDDEGPGVPRDIRERIFDPFFTTGDGSGLGLSISYRIVQAHGGTLEAVDAPGGGARFMVRLPVAGAGAVSTRAGSRA